MQDTLAKMLAGMAEGGWSQLENLQKGFGEIDSQISERERAQERAEAALAARVLDTEDGRAFLDLLLRKTVLRPPSEQECAAATAETYAILKAKREGQNQIVFTLLGMLQQHHLEKQTTGGTAP